MSKIIGIDLWTTNSCFAYMLWDKAEVISNAEWDRTTPSVVYIKWDQMLVWKLAKRKAVLEPKNVIYEVKRFIWRKFSEVQDEIKRIPYEIKQWTDWWVLIVVDGKEYRPEQISAFILQKIKQDAEKFLGDTVDRAVITVPAYFNDSQRNATKAAWEIAWLKVERIINEPTASALAYGIDKAKDEKIAVFDFGWGTHDVTILDIGSEWTFQVLATNWDTHLGWADVDKKIINFLLESFKTKEWIDLSGQAMALQRLKEEAENAKIGLSQADSVDINIPFIMTGPDGQPKHLQEVLTKAMFDNMTKDLVDRTIAPLSGALSDAWVSKNEINEVILVWGSTRIPSVKKALSNYFGKDPKATVNPDEAVALWAAIQWGILQWDVKDILLLDVTPLSLWVEVEWGLAHIVIPRNTTIPVRKSNIYTNAADNQPAVTIHVVQWERSMAGDNKSLWMFNLDWIPPMRRWQAQIEVAFDIDANGILHVSAQEKTTGKEQKVTIQWATWISDEEIKRAQADAEKFAEEDKKKKELIESKNKLETLAYQLEQFKSEHDSKLDEESKTKIAEMISDAHKLKEDSNTTKEQYEAKFNELQNELMALYQKVNPQQGAQPTQWEPSQWPTDWQEDPTTYNA